MAVTPRLGVCLVASLWALGTGRAQQPLGPPSVSVGQNPVVATPASLAAGKASYDTYCAGCHGNRAQGAVRAGVPISIIQEMAASSRRIAPMTSTITGRATATCSPPSSVASRRR